MAKEKDISTSQPWEQSSNMDLCKSFLAQLPEEQRQVLLSPYLSKSNENSAPQPKPTPDCINEHSPRDRNRPTPNGRQKLRATQSGSRKRRQVNHADENIETDKPTSANGQASSKGPSVLFSQKEYPTVPVFLQNNLAGDIKDNPKRLCEVIQLLKPEAKIQSVSICRSGDLKLIAVSPHDENILRQPWADHETFGKFKPRLPKEKTVNQEVTILNLPTCISNKEIQENLKERFITPKDIFRFNKKGSNEPSRNVKVTLGSKQEKDHLLSHGFGIYHQNFKVVENKPLPKVLQCFKCQKFGHNFFECREPESTCVRCGGSHRHTSCITQKDHAKCANCSGNHAANYKGCTKYKEAVENAKKIEKAKQAPSTYAASVQSNKQPNTESLLACLAECLSELASLFKNSIEKGEAMDDMAPFSIVSHAAARHFDIKITNNDLFLKGICPSPQNRPKPGTVGEAPTYPSPSTSTSAL